MKAQPGVIETYNGATNSILRQLEADPVALEEPGGMESHQRAEKDYLGSLRFTLKH
jgi:hypothetical protein